MTLYQIAIYKSTLQHSACFEHGKSYPGENINAGGTHAESAHKCQEMCQEDERCKLFNWKTTTKSCQMKEQTTNDVAIESDSFICGPKFCNNTGKW